MVLRLRLSSSTFSGGMSSYASVPRYDTESPRPSFSANSPSTPVPTGKPSFKGSGMKLGGKKLKQDDVLNALGAEAADAPLVSNATPAPLERAPSIEIPQVPIPSVQKKE